MADKIIVVDDEREIADLIGLYLENDGYEVHKFLNGADALSFVEKCEPALAVLDVMLPDTDGFALLRKMREKHDFPIIMLSDTPEAGIPNEIAVPLSDAKSKLMRSQTLLREETARKNDLVMYLAHDLKTPLASVIGYLTLLRDEQQISPELREKYLSITLDKAERLEDLINEFFEITRFNLSTVTLDYSSIDLVRLLEQLRFEFMPMLKEKSLTCTLCAPDALPIICDAGKMQRVFDNLLRNAVLYSYPDTEIVINAQLDGDSVSVSVVNRGNTIPEEKLRRIFEQFYRLDSARSSSGGAGLGLAIASNIVTLHGGKINARSADETVEFTVTLPVRKS